MRISTLLAGCTLIVPSWASAHWQYTQWGMTPQQVIAASKGKVGWRPVSFPKPGDPAQELGGNFTAGSRTFDVRFTFSEGKLSLVALTLNDCGSSMVTDLKSTYGQPINETKGPFPFWEWDDKRNRNRVTLFKLIGSCLITYGNMSDRNQGL